MAGVKRVLVVSNMYPSVQHQAGGIFVHEQVKALRHRGLDARVVTGKPVWLSGRRPLTALRLARGAARERWPGWVAHEGVPVARFPYLVGAWSRPWLHPVFYAGALRRWLPALEQDFPYDLVHVHTAFLDGRAGTAAAQHRSVPMVLTEHTGPLSMVTSDARWRRHTQAGVDGADRLIAVSEALRRDMLEQLQIAHPDRLAVLPNGVDTSFFDPAQAAATAASGPAKAEDIQRVLHLLAARLEQQAEPLATGTGIACAIRDTLEDLAWMPEPELPGTGDPAIRALWVGHHVEVKRGDRLLDAFAVALRQQPALQLTLLGNGPLEPMLRQRADTLGVADRVHFLPAADRRGVRRAMAHADFLVLPSQSETFGVVVIEALAMGLPVLATACGGPQDILDDPRLGLLVSNTLEGITHGLERMAADLASFDRSTIRLLAVERFDYARLAARLEAVYQEVAGRVSAG